MANIKEFDDTPKFDIEEIIRTYTPPEAGSKRALNVAALINEEGFVNKPDVFALIGTGGTLSSGYSPKLERLIPGKYRAAERILIDLKEKFKIITSNFSSLDIFAKDSREIERDDIILLLDTLHSIKNKRIFIGTGTYMLPLITEILMRTEIDSSKIIGVTGSILPIGLPLSDTPINTMSTVTAINQRHALKDTGVKISNIMAIFHGQIYDSLESIRALTLHPKETDDLVIEYPQAFTPSKIQ